MTKYHIFDPKNGNKLSEVNADSREDAVIKYYARNKPGNTPINVMVVASRNYEVLSATDVGLRNIERQRR